MELILTLNAGSSSLKFAIYTCSETLQLWLTGQVYDLGQSATLSYTSNKAKVQRDIGAADHAVALNTVFDELESVIEAEYGPSYSLIGVGHRVVHGGSDFDQPMLVNQSLLDELASLVPLAPLHQPHNISAIHAALERLPNAKQIACFDTAFHRSQPWVSDTFALPRPYYEQGVRRYGFHGLSYHSIADSLATIKPALLDANVIIAHLGNGASMCALQNGRSVGSTMGFSPLDGLTMSTRCGQLDPAVVLYLLNQNHQPEEISDLLYKQSGLLGLSGLSSDMRDLLASSDSKAQQAIDYYSLQIRREIGAMASTMGGLDALIFCGGVGENSPQIRALSVERLDFLGLEIDHTLNQQSPQKTSQNIGSGVVEIRVIATDEERIIAQSVFDLLR